MILKEFEKLNNQQIRHLRNQGMHDKSSLEKRILERKYCGFFNEKCCSTCWEIFKILGLRE
jgi:hypothetical protein